MAELLLLLPEYMAVLLDQTEWNAGGHGSKLQWSGDRLLMSKPADGGGSALRWGHCCQDVASCRPSGSLGNG